MQNITRVKSTILTLDGRGGAFKNRCITDAGSSKRTKGWSGFNPLFISEVERSQRTNKFHSLEAHVALRLGLKTSCFTRTLQIRAIQTARLLRAARRSHKFCESWSFLLDTLIHVWSHAEPGTKNDPESGLATSLIHQTCWGCSRLCRRLFFAKYRFSMIQ